MWKIVKDTMKELFKEEIGKFINYLILLISLLGGIFLLNILILIILLMKP